MTPFRSDAPQERSPGLFFGLVAILTVPFWIVSAIANVELLPGLPLAALSVVCPAIAALALAYRAGGSNAMFAMARRAFDCRKISLFWYAPILLINPAISVLSFVVLRLIGTSLPHYAGLDSADAGSRSGDGCQRSVRGAWLVRICDRPDATSLGYGRCRHPDWNRVGSLARRSTG